MRIYDIITEYRKNPTLNSKRDIISTLLKYSNSEDYYVTFSTIDKVGVNPSSNWTTPNGVYAYPLYLYRTKLMDENSKDIKHVGDVFPYASDRKFIFILKATVEVVTYDESPWTANNILYKVNKCVSELYGEELTDASENLLNDVIMTNKHIGEHAIIFSYLRELLSSQFSRLGKNRTNAFNKMLRYLSYDAICDNGFGFIHPNEKMQAVFLSPSAYKVVDSMINTFQTKDDIVKKTTRTDHYPIINGVLKRHLNLMGNKNLHKLPKNLRVVNGNINLSNSSIKYLPNNLTVNGNLNVSGSDIIELPNNLTVKGTLNCNYTNITSFPSDIKCLDAVNITYMPVSHLPDNLTIGGSFYAPVYLKKLPSGLRVGGHLFLLGNPMYDLPDDIVVHGNVLLNSSITINRYLKLDKPKGIKGSIMYLT